MTDWLVARHEQLQLYLWLGSFVLVALWESFQPRREFSSGTGIRWLTNVGLMALGFLLARVALPFAAYSFALFAQTRGWGLFNQLSLPTWLACVIAVLMLDLGNYGVHRLFHVVPVLWRCHKIHHSDLDVDCGTAIRHHPIEFVIALGADLLIIAAIGAPPAAVLIATVVGAIASVFNHGNVMLPATLDRPVRRILVTPDMHRIHHSALIAEINSNFSNLLPWWDHLFATYREEPEAGHELMELGLSEARTPGDVTLWKLLAMPFRVTGSALTPSTPETDPQT